MKVGAYQIGRYYAIIKKFYEDGSYDYETSFSDRADLMTSFYSLKRCEGMLIGIATKTPKVLTNIEIIRGKADIVKELIGKESTHV